STVDRNGARTLFPPARPPDKKTLHAGSQRGVFPPAANQRDGGPSLPSHEPAASRGFFASAFRLRSSKNASWKRFRFRRRESPRGAPARGRERRKAGRRVAGLLGRRRRARDRGVGLLPCALVGRARADA